MKKKKKWHFFHPPFALVPPIAELTPLLCSCPFAVQFKLHSKHGVGALPLDLEPDSAKLKTKLSVAARAQIIRQVVCVSAHRHPSTVTGGGCVQVRMREHVLADGH